MTEHTHDTEPIYADTVSVDYDSASNELIMRIVHDHKPGKPYTTTEVRIPVDAAIKFAGQVGNTFTALMRHALRQSRIGDCRRCNNTRLVQNDKNGRKVSERCPECGNRFENLPPVPSVRSAGPRKR